MAAQISAPILIADDDPRDRALMERILEGAKITNPLQFVEDGDQTIAYLAGMGRYSNRTLYPLPALLLLDLKMPTVDGFEVLRWLQSRPASFAVVVLSALSDLKDIRQAYALGAHSFLVKPLTVEEMTNLVEGLKGLTARPNSQGSSIEYHPPEPLFNPGYSKSFLP